MKLKTPINLAILVPLFFAVLGLSSCNNGSTVDYAKEESWIIRTETPTYAYDCFYLVPTAWFSTDSDAPMYINIDDEDFISRAQLDYEYQAKILENQCNMYAPLYRQSNAFKCLSVSLEEQEEINLRTPYQDCVEAFEYYLNHYNNGRPFILAGHSQGSNMIKYLLRDYLKDKKEISDRMIATYAPGYSFESSFFEENSFLSFAQQPDDVNVVISWNCEMQKVDGTLGSNNLVCHVGALSINPISWSHDGVLVAQDDARNLGSALLPDKKFSTQTVYDYNRHYEVLIVGVDSDAYLSSGIGETSLHGYDWIFFLNNIRENVALRAETFLNR